MSIQTNENLPGYTPESFKEFIRVVTKEWNLPPEYIGHADSYFLNHLTALQIDAILSGDGITISTKNQEVLTFLPLFNRTAIEAYNFDLQNEGERLFWLSFRAIRYPLGTTERVAGRYAGNLKAYVLIQLDKKS